MRKLLTFVLPVLAVAAGCGVDSKSCSTSPATLASGQAPVATCSVAPGSTVQIPVRLCAKCSDSGASCGGSEFRQTSLGTFVDINPVFQQCEEDRGCPISPGCENNASASVSCDVFIPQGTAPDTYPVLYEGSVVGQIQVGASGGCSFAKASP